MFLTSQNGEAAILIVPKNSILTQEQMNLQETLYKMNLIEEVIMTFLIFHASLSASPSCRFL